MMEMPRATGHGPATNFEVRQQLCGSRAQVAMVEGVVDNPRRRHLLFSRSLRVGAGSSDDGRQTNALSDVRNACGCGEIGRCLVNLITPQV
jgi:hypothetical protein